MDQPHNEGLANLDINLTELVTLILSYEGHKNF